MQKDLANLEKGHLLIQNAVKQILYKELQLYNKDQYNSEFLARIYQLLGMSREINSRNNDFPFRLQEIVNVFSNSCKWIEQKFNEVLKTQISEHIAKLTSQVEFDKHLNDFSRKYKSIHKGEKPSWKKNIGSIFD